MRLAFNKKLKSKYSVFVALTEEDKKSWKLQNCVVIPNFSLFRGKCTDEREKKVIAVGRLTFQKGFDQLIEIWARVIRRNGKDKTWPLEIYGCGEEEESLNVLIKESHLEDSITLKGNVSNIAQVYNSSSIIAVTSRYEGFPLSIIEGMSCGVVPVSFDCKQGPKEIITNQSGYLINQGDYDGFANALINLMNDEKKLRQMSLNSIERANQFSPEKVMQKWNDLFVSLTSAGK